MLSVLIETHNDEEALAQTLAPLVTGAVEGIVRDVIVRDLGSTDHTRTVAEHAGCHVEKNSSVAACVSAARGDWVLVLEPGARLLEGWVDDLVRHIGHADQPARFSRSRKERTPFLARVFGPSRALAQGLLISKSRAMVSARGAANVDALARGLATRLLSAEIIPASRRN